MAESSLRPHQWQAWAGRHSGAGRLDPSRGLAREDQTQRNDEDTEAVGGSMPLAGIAGKVAGLSITWHRGRSASMGWPAWRSCPAGSGPWHGTGRPHAKERGRHRGSGWLNASSWHCWETARAGQRMAQRQVGRWGRNRRGRLNGDRHFGPDQPPAEDAVAAGMEQACSAGWRSQATQGLMWPKMATAILGQISPGPKARWVSEQPGKRRKSSQGDKDRKARKCGKLKSRQSRRKYEFLQFTMVQSSRS